MFKLTRAQDPSQPPTRKPIQPIVPEPEIVPDPGQPEVVPRRTEPELVPEPLTEPEIFPQHSPDATPPEETPTTPEQPSREIPPLHDQPGMSRS
jgi:hypothetical protein